MAGDLVNSFNIFACTKLHTLSGNKGINSERVFVTIVRSNEKDDLYFPKMPVPCCSL